MHNVTAGPEQPVEGSDGSLDGSQTEELFSPSSGDNSTAAPSSPQTSGPTRTEVRQ